MTRFRILMLTHNRAGYTALSLKRLCETLPEDARVTVWDNASERATVEVLKRFEGHRRVERIIYNKTNDKLRGPTNWFWKNAGEAEFLGKVDDDCLVPENWCDTLAAAHRDIPQAGLIGCWHFPEEDFNHEVARRKIQAFGRHQLMRNCWIGGSGYLMKRTVIDRIGVLQDGESFTNFCIRSAAAGWINGWYFPFLYQEHMDDPRMPHTGLQSETDFQRLNPLSAGTFNVKTREEWIKRLKYSAWSVQACSFDPHDYSGWKAWLRRKIGRLTGRPIVPGI